MKTAVFVSGMPGNLMFSLNEINNKIVKPLNADLFLWFWYTDNLVVRGNEPKRSYNKEYTEEIVELFSNPIKLEMHNFDLMSNKFVEMSKKISTNNKIKNCIGHIPNIFSHWYAVKQCYNMLISYSTNNSIKYDTIIKLRTEVMVYNNISSDIIQHKNKCIIIPSGYGDGGIHKDGLCGINDFMAFGDKKSIGIYSMLYDNIIEYANELGIIHAETFMLHHLLKNDVKILRVNFPGKLYKEGIGCPHPNSWTSKNEYPGNVKPEDL